MPLQDKLIAKAESITNERLYAKHSKQSIVNIISNALYSGNLGMDDDTADAWAHKLVKQIEPEVKENILSDLEHSVIEHCECSMYD